MVSVDVTSLVSFPPCNLTSPPFSFVRTGSVPYINNNHQTTSLFNHNYSRGPTPPTDPHTMIVIYAPPDLRIPISILEQIHEPLNYPPIMPVQLWSLVIILRSGSPSLKQPAFSPRTLQCTLTVQNFSRDLSLYLCLLTTTLSPIHIYPSK